jgi:hypothetical protein
MQYRANQTIAIADPAGHMRPVAAGDLIDGDDERNAWLVRDFAWLLDPMDGPETTSASPGEKRTSTRRKATTPDEA